MFRNNMMISLSFSPEHFYSSRTKNVHQFKETEISHLPLIEFEPLIELKLHTNVKIITFRNLLWIEFLSFLNGIWSSKYILSFEKFLQLHFPSLQLFLLNLRKRYQKQAQKL